MSKELNELITGIGQLVEGYTHTAEELDKLKSLYEKMKLEVAEEFEYPFEENEQYWLVGENGGIENNRWNDMSYDKRRYNQGNVFKTEQEAVQERDKRAFLTRFRQFRDKCNGDWKPERNDEKHWFYLSGSKAFLMATDVGVSSYPTFGYFKNTRDCLHAMDLFGDEIIQLWVDE